MGNEMLFFAAGASVEAGVPSAWKMSKEIVAKFNSDKRYARFKDALNFVNDTLVKHARTVDPKADCVDVESLYNALLLLEERDGLETAPFVEEWKSELGAIPDAPSLFKEIRYQMTAMLEELTTITDSSRVEYLAPIIDLAKRQNGLFVATLNYDNAVELLCEDRGESWDTGIKAWEKAGIIQCHHHHTINLIKLHGSCYWYWTDEMTTTADKPMPWRIVFSKSRLNEPKRFMVAADTNMVIFGQKNKLTADGPFLDLIRVWDEELAKTNILTIVGYSFRDSHINHYISKFLNAGGGNELRVVNPSFETLNVPYAAILRDRRDNRRIDLKVIDKVSGDPKKFTENALKELYT